MHMHIEPTVYKHLSLYRQGPNMGILNPHKTYSFLKLRKL